MIQGLFQRMAAMHCCCCCCCRRVTGLREPADNFAFTFLFLFNNPVLYLRHKYISLTSWNTHLQTYRFPTAQNAKLSYSQGDTYNFLSRFSQLLILCFIRESKYPFHRWVIIVSIFQNFSNFETFLIWLLTRLQYTQPDASSTCGMYVVRRT